MLAAELKRRQRIHQLSELLWKQPREQWPQILSTHESDPEIVAEAMEERRSLEDADYIRDIPEDRIRRLFEEEDDETDE